MNIMEWPRLWLYGGAIAVSLLGALVLIWIVVAIQFLVASRGLTPALNNFFAAIVTGNYTSAYAMTTPQFQTLQDPKTFKEWVKTHKLRQYKRLELPPFEVQNNCCTLPLRVELNSGEWVSLDTEWIRIAGSWQLNRLDDGPTPTP